jgi:hypothetical protein
MFFPSACWLCTSGEKHIDEEKRNEKTKKKTSDKRKTEE